MIYYETELYHHGVKGQKWGRRKQRPMSRGQMAAQYKAKNADRAARYSQSKTAKTNRRRNIASLGIGIGTGAASTVGVYAALKKLGAKDSTSAEVAFAAGVGGTIAGQVLSRKAMRTKK